MRSSKGSLIGLAAFASVLALGACGDDKVVRVDGEVTGDATFPDAPTDSTPHENVQPLVRALEFKQAFGDDQQPCVGAPRCTIFLGYNEEKTLELSYTEDGLRVAGQPVMFALENDLDDLGDLNTFSSATNAEGIAAVKTHPQISVTGQYTVKAWVDNSTIPPKYFDIQVSPKGVVALTVVGTYQGVGPVYTYGVKIYKQSAAGVPGCQDLSSLYARTADQLKEGLLITQSAKFTTFAGLEADRTQKYTVLAYSLNGVEAVQAWGCNASDGLLEWGKSKTVAVELIDRAPQYEGLYEVTNRFDLTSAIPEPYRTYVDYVLGFFRTPTGTILNIACDLLPRDDGGQLNGFCDMVFDEVNGNLQLSTIGGFVADLLDAVIQSLLKETVFSSIFQVGGEVAEILQAFEITALFDFKKEPNADGVFAAGDTEETWTSVAFKWSLGANCAATEEGCGVRSFPLNAFQTATVRGTFPASVANFFDLSIGKHSLNLRYGALIDFFLQAVLIPIIVNDPTVDSYDDLLGFLVGGGSECVGEQGRCCGIFADKVLGDEDGQYEPGSGGDGADAAAVFAACSTIQSAAPGFLSQTLTNLDLSTGEGFMIGTDGPCRLRDSNSDMKIDLIGTPFELDTPTNQLCKWDVELKFSDSTSIKIDKANFWGHRIDR